MTRFLKKCLSSNLLKNHSAFFLLIWSIIGLISGSMILFLAFLFNGAFVFVDFHMNVKNSLLLDAFLSLLFFLQHSLLIRTGIRQKLSRFIANEYYGAFYGASSGIALILVLLFWQRIPPIIGAAESSSFWPFRATFFLGLLFLFWGMKSLGRFDLHGVEPAVDAINNEQIKPYPFKVQGAYRWVRHPNYFGLLILFWSCPEITLDRLWFNILWSIYIVIGTHLEESELLEQFGNRYRQYKSRVPMLVPYRIPRDISLID